MRIEESVIKELRQLPAEKKLEVLRFVGTLRQAGPKPPRRSLWGLWKDVEIDITEADIAEAREEMWGNFPREDF